LIRFCSVGRPVEVDHAAAAIGYAEVLADAGVQRFRDVSDLFGNPDALAWVEARCA